MSLYFPILRSKEAEWRALSELAPPVRDLMTPVIEVPASALARRPVVARRRGLTPATNAIKDLCDRALTCSERVPLALDLKALGQARAAIGGEPWRVLPQALPHGVKLIPVVTRAARQQDLGAVKEALSHFQAGLLLRLGAEDVNDASILSWIAITLNQLGVDRNRVDILIDLQDQPTRLSHDAMRKRLEAPGGWRSWVVCAGVFPPDLSQFDGAQQEHLLPRAEWISWRTQALKVITAERPRYGDYTIQHAFARDVKSPPSMSVRYSKDDDYLILRGRQARGGIGSEQYFGHARLLVGGTHFYGEGFSPGDAFISAKAAATVRPGGFKDWLAAGISHHLTLVISQLRPILL